MRTIADWQRCNNSDVVPGLEVLEKMRNEGSDEGISIPRMSFSFVFRRSVGRRAELHSPAKKSCERLKELLLGYKALEPGVVIKAAHRTIEYQLARTVTWCVEQVKDVERGAVIKAAY